MHEEILGIYPRSVFPPLNCILMFSSKVRGYLKKCLIPIIVILKPQSFTQKNTLASTD